MAIPAVPLGTVISGSAGAIGGTLWTYIPAPGAPALVVGDRVRKVGSETVFVVGFVMVNGAPGEQEFFFEIANNVSAFSLSDAVEVVLRNPQYVNVSVTRTRQFRSSISLQYAEQQAAAAAKAAAEAELMACFFTACSAATGPCGRVEERCATSFISLADAHEKALIASHEAAAYWCYENPGGENEESNLPRTPLDDVALILVVHPGYVPYMAETVASIERQTLRFTRKVLVYDAAFELEPPTIEIPEDWTVTVGNWRNPNLARNEGLKLMLRTTWLCFWDADNRMPDTYLQSALRPLIQSDARVGVLYPDIQETYCNGTFGYFHQMPEWSLAAGQFRSLADTGSFWRTAAVREVGGFQADQFGHDDYSLSLRIFRAGWRGQAFDYTLNHLVHDGARSQERELTQSLWTAYSFAFVTLWSGNRETAEKVLVWLATAEIPPNSHLYWVDNSGGKMEQMLHGVYGALLRKRFKRVTFIDAGEPFEIDPSQHYRHLERHSHVAYLYNRVLPGLREEIVVTLEDDTVPPHDGVRTLLSNFRPGSPLAMAAGVYRARHNPAHICASIDKVKWRNVPKFEELPDRPFEVGMTGGGFALIGNHALQTCLPMRCEQTPDGRLMGWDGNMGLSLTALGYKIVADPRVKCAHLCPEVKDFENGRPWKKCPDDEYSPYGPYGS